MINPCRPRDAHPKRYGKPVFFRGTGLGNRLFQWARCRVWCYENNAQMVHPRWTRISLGHLVRRTVPLSDYLSRIALLGVFEPHPEDISGINAAWQTRFAQIELESDGWPDIPPIQSRPLLRIFNDSDYSFNRLNKWQERLTQDLESSIAFRWRNAVDHYRVPTIGLNIRLGKDFSPPPLTDHNSPYDWVGWLQQTPLSWFIETLELIREASGWMVPAVIVSDGSDDQLRPLLQLPLVERFRPSNPATDLLILSRTRLLLGSGSSTFSAWSAFIGQQTVITAPGHPFSRLGLVPLHGQMIASFDPRRPHPGVAAELVAAVKQSSRRSPS